MSIQAPSAIGDSGADAPVLIALGANLPGPYGAPEKTLEAACRFFENHMLIMRRSAIWLTAPVPASDQPWYRNAVISIETDKAPRDLLEFLRDTEARFGRVRAGKNEARILDLDLIAYRNEIKTEPDLSVPHPRMQDRAFVLLPLQEIAPDWIHPVSKTPLAELIKNLPPGQTAMPMHEAAG